MAKRTDPAPTQPPTEPAIAPAAPQAPQGAPQPEVPEPGEPAEQQDRGPAKSFYEGEPDPVLAPQGRELPEVLAMPDAVLPDPEPPAPIESWRDVTPGSPAFPVKKLDGTYAAGGLVADTLCIEPSGAPRCVHLDQGGRCSGPPTMEMRRSMTSCVAYKDRNAGR